jgi:hypothetical protein
MSFTRPVSHDKRSLANALASRNISRINTALLVFQPERSASIAQHTAKVPLKSCTLETSHAQSPVPLNVVAFWNIPVMFSTRPVSQLERSSPMYDGAASMKLMSRTFPTDQDDKSPLNALACQNFQSSFSNIGQRVRLSTKLSCASSPRVASYHICHSFYAACIPR